MSKVETKIQLTDMTPAWGLVCVTTRGHSEVVRAHRITREEFEAFETTGKLPYCISQKEWDDGGVVIAGRPCLPGQGVIQSDGSMVINYGIKDDGSMVDVSLMRVYPREFDVIDGVIYLLPSIARQVDVRHSP